MKLIHFTAEWCQPCKMMKPVINSVLEEYPNIEYSPIDIDKDMDTALQYDVRGVPTFITEEHGEVIKRVSGAMTKNQFVEALDIDKPL
jgi:thioredoxin 1